MIAIELATQYSASSAIAENGNMFLDQQNL